MPLPTLIRRLPAPLALLPALGFAAALLLPNAATAAAYKFDWRGQIAGFSVRGQFAYDDTQPIADGIVRKQHLTAFDVSFFAPDGSLLRTYTDNHLNFPAFNFNFDTNQRRILQEGSVIEPNGINIGEKTDDGMGNFTGLSFWSLPDPYIPEFAVPHVHFDDWGNAFGFPIGYNDHNDVAFPGRTTQELLDSGLVGAAWVNQLASEPGDFGLRMTAEPVPLPPAWALLALGLPLLRAHRPA